MIVVVAFGRARLTGGVEVFAGKMEKKNFDGGGWSLRT